MMSFIAQAGYASAVIDFTNDFSSLFIGLIGVTAIAAAMIVVEITRYQIVQKTRVGANAVSIPTECQQAA